MKHQMNQSKFDTIYTNMINGNRSTAANQVRNLSKLQTVQLLTEWHTYHPAMIGDLEAISNWHRFIVNSLYNDGLI